MDARLAQLFDDEFDAMVRLAAVMLGSSNPEIEDVVMSAFVATGERLDDVVRPGAYLRTSVVNGCRRKLRDRSRRERIWRTEVAPLHATSIDGDPEYVNDLLSVLTERERTAIVLTYYLDLPQRAVARELGCRVGTVKSLLHRAMGKLRTAVPR